MKKISSKSLGIDQGEVQLFSDYENGGEMWVGSGTRERRERVSFSETFHNAPVVQVALSLFDVSNGANIRADLYSENVDERGFDMVFRTWQDSQIARARLSWTAFGEVADEDRWDV